MPNEIRIKPIASAAFTCTLASLAAAGARQTTLLTNSNNYQGALVNVRIKSATAPVAGTVYEVYLLRSDGTVMDDGAGASDAAITILNAPLLGTIVVTAATASFYGVFDTAPLGPLGTSWGIAIKNGTAQTISATEGDHAARYTYYVPEVQ